MSAAQNRFKQANVHSGGSAAREAANVGVPKSVTLGCSRIALLVLQAARVAPRGQS